MKILPPALAGLALAGAVLALAGPASAQSGQCLRMSDTSSWKTTPDARIMYLRARIRDVYEVRLRAACPALRRIGVHLVHQVDSDTVCSATAFDLRVGDANSGFPPIQCQVESFRALSPEEIAALPKNLRP